MKDTPAHRPAGALTCAAPLRPPRLLLRLLRVRRLVLHQLAGQQRHGVTGALCRDGA